MSVRLIVDDWVAGMRQLPDASVQMVGPTSPPYFQLRDYGTASWEGGDPGCDHRHETKHQIQGATSQRQGRANTEAQRNENFRGSCPRCGAARVDRQIGSEPTPDEFVRVLVDGFREARRVLRDDGILVLNLGDSMSGSRKGPTGKNGIGDQGKRQGFVDVKTVASLPPKNLLMLPFRVAIALQQDGWILRSVIPWVKRNCLSGGAWVYVRSQKGDMPMTVKELSRLNPSTVQLWNGERWTRLVKVWRVEPEGDPLEIRLRSGETIGCTPDHRWPTQRGLLHARELCVGDVIQMTKLPAREDARRPSALDDDDIGWFVGLYIAEGCRDRSVIHIASHTREVEREQRLQRIAAAYDGTCWTFQRGGNSMTINVSGPVLHGILDAYVEGEGAVNKHLTTKAWQRSDAFLRAVLDGYLHGDGHHDTLNRRWRLGFCENDRWATDLRALCARLGIGLRLNRCQHMLNGRKMPGWRGQIRFDRENRSQWTQFPMAEDGEIVAIGKSKGRSFWDLEVADEPHLFALASGVLTHNCMPESVTDRPTNAIEYLFLLSKSPRYFWDGEAIRQPNTPGSLARFGKDPRLSGAGPKTTAEGLGVKNNGSFKTALTHGIVPDGGRAFRNSDPFWMSWQGLWCDEGGSPLALLVNPQARKGSHYARFPNALVEPFVRAGTSQKGACPQCGSPWRRVVERGYRATPKACKGVTTRADAAAAIEAGDQGARRARDGHIKGLVRADQTLGWEQGCACPPAEPRPCVVLDPFGGGGTVGVVADRLGRDAILIELNPSYAADALAEIRDDAPMLVDVAIEETLQLDLFGEVS